MNGFLLWGLGSGVACALAYVLTALYHKKQPVLAHGIEVLLSGFGLVSGFKLCYLVFSGQMTQIIEHKPPSVATSLAAEDVIYFVVGGVALVWLSAETIVKRVKRLTAAGEPAAE